MNAESIKKMQEVHLAIWNERSRSTRDSMIAQIYADEIKMYDPDSILKGTKEISDFIDKVQSDSKFTIKATQPMESTQNGARLFWTITTEEGLLKGMDFFILENEKVTNLYVFIES